MNGRGESAFQRGSGSTCPFLRPFHGTRAGLGRWRTGKEGISA
ncbi:hypothetical protein Y88_2777 [Novosphingobium nitrogenifigens DSM 19370]|uniref:Uncharacterized protein n=1 Tax=Novosphingobium nitrogenifigens DSM 19370 TaxID=983920 RepID=F1Z477_9SPHN|nr:hypothetical protein Y88_2777 [Novosphingobium nitrogenifigens DSM 19370]